MWRRVRAAAAPARDGGKAYDTAMNVRYTRMGAAAPDEPCQAAMEAAIHDSFAGTELPLDEWRTPARYIDLVRAYNEHYGDEPWDVLGVQLPFEVALGEVQADNVFWRHVYAACVHDFELITNRMANGLRCRKCKGFKWVSESMATDLNYQQPVQVRLHGILDLLVRNRDTGLVLVPDTKVTERLDSRALARHQNSGQFKAYCWAVPQMRKQHGDTLGVPWTTLPDRIDGAFVNACIIREPYRNDSSAKRYNAKPRNEFHRVTVTFSDERLEEWRRDALKWVQGALQCVADDHWPANEQSCGNCYGSPCEYLDTCVLPVEQRALSLGSDLFEDYKRGPLADAPQENA